MVVLRLQPKCLCRRLGGINHQLLLWPTVFPCRDRSGQRTIKITAMIMLVILGASFQFHFGFVWFGQPIRDLFTRARLRSVWITVNNYRDVHHFRDVHRNTIADGCTIPIVVPIIVNSILM